LPVGFRKKSIVEYGKEGTAWIGDRVVEIGGWIGDQWNGLW